MGQCCVQERPYDISNTTFITYSDLIQDVDDETDEQMQRAQDAIYNSSPDKNYSFKVRLSKFKGKLFWEDKWYVVIHVDNAHQNIIIESGESTGRKDIRWSLDQTFFFKEKYK